MNNFFGIKFVFISYIWVWYFAYLDTSGGFMVHFFVHPILEFNFVSEERTGDVDIFTSYNNDSLSV